MRERGNGYLRGITPVGFSLNHEGKEESSRDREQEQCMFVHAFLKQNLSLTLTPRSLAAKVGL